MQWDSAVLNFALFTLCNGNYFYEKNDAPKLACSAVIKQFKPGQSISQILQTKNQCFGLIVCTGRTCKGLQILTFSSCLPRVVLFFFTCDFCTHTLIHDYCLRPICSNVLVKLGIALFCHNRVQQAVEFIYY